MMAVTLPLLVLAPLAGGIYDRIGPRGLVAGGCAAGAAGMIWVAAVLDKDSYPWMVPGYVLIGAGIGLVMGPSNTDAMSAAAAEFRAQAQGVIQTMRQVGATIGLAIMGVVVTQVEDSRLESSLSALGLPESAISQVENVLSKGADGQQDALAQVPAAERAAIVADVQDSVTDGISAALYIGGAALAVAAVVGFLVLRHVHYDDEGDPPIVAAGLIHGAVAAPPVAGHAVRQAAPERRRSGVPGAPAAPTATQKGAGRATRRRRCARRPPSGPRPRRPTARPGPPGRRPRATAERGGARHDPRARRPVGRGTPRVRGRAAPPAWPDPHGEGVPAPGPRPPPGRHYSPLGRT